MKKTTLAMMALLAGTTLGTPAMAQELSPTADKNIYDFSGFNDETLLNLFYQALKQGRNYPTAAEFEKAGIQASDIAFVRSHVRKGKLLDFSDRVVPTTYEKRNLWMNLPTDAGKDGGVGYPSTKFASDTYSMWNYTNLFGSWNHGLFQAPGCWVDAAHQNGSDIMSGIKFFESWTPGSGDGAYSALITKKDAKGNFIYVKPLINCLMFFGSDGINYNWEDGSYSDSEIVAFHKALYKEAEAQGFDNFHIGIYTSQATLTQANVEALYGSKKNGKTADTMLNYMSDDFTYTMANSVQTAEDVMGTADGLYAGVWIVTMDRGWDRLDKGDAHRCGLCLWGEHDQSRFWSYNVGSDAYDAQGNYQRLLERGFSGGNRNPLRRPAVSKTGNNWEPEGTKAPLQSFCGLANFIPERSAIQGNLPFSTHFTLGNGDRYYYKGKKTAGSWYNMAAQDLVPTYRWLVTKAGTNSYSKDVAVNYTHLDAYTGGSCIELSGKAVAAGTDIVLYKTLLKVSGSKPYAKIAVKSGKEGSNASDLYLIFKKQGSEKFEEVAFGNVEGKAWQEKTLEIPSLSTGDVIERIGLRVKGDNKNYKLMVGKLEINDNSVVKPANVKDLVVEVKQETTSSMTMKLNWGVDATAKTRGAWDLVYNDEANIDHFQVLYKLGEKGHVAEVGRTSQWATVVGDLTFENESDEPYVGVRSVSTDQKTYSPIVWVKVPRAAQDQLPEPENLNDTYGISAMDPNCQGADIARKERYVTSVVTKGADQNLNYKANSPVADGSQYADARKQVIKVKQGQEVSITIKCADFDDGLKWCFAGGWLDLDGSGTFDHPLGVTTNVEGEATDPLGERLFRVGKVRAASPEFQSTGITAKFKIPEDAAPGKSRLRIVFSDAWFAGAFLPVGLHAKGFTIDFGAEISGTNPHRFPTDSRDQGLADEPEDMKNSTGIEEVEGEISEVTLNGESLNFKNVEKAWIYTVDGKFVQFVQKGQQVSTKNLVPGVYLVKMMNKSVIRSSKIIVK